MIIVLKIFTNLAILWMLHFCGSSIIVGWGLRQGMTLQGTQVIGYKPDYVQKLQFQGIRRALTLIGVLLFAVFTWGIWS